MSIISTLSLFDGKCCSRCKGWKPFDEYSLCRRNIDGRQNCCKGCFKVISAEQRTRDRGKLNQYKREWRVVRADLTIAYNTVNAERRRESRRNSDKSRYDREYKNNPHKYLSKRHKRRMLLKDNGGTYTQEEWIALCVFYDNRCLCCGKQKPLTVDHVIPLSQGGPNYIDNIQPLCKSCNTAKGDRHIDYRIRAE